MRPPTIALAALLGAATLPAIGCTVEHRLELSNNSTRPISARVTLERSVRDRSIMEEATVRPGMTKVFAPVEASVLDKVRLEIEDAGEPGLPTIRQRLDIGDNTFELGEIGEFGDYGVGGLRLRRLPG